MRAQATMTILRALSALTVAATFAATASAADQSDYEKMQNELVSAEDLLSADVTNTLNPVGSVNKLVLSPDRSKLQYVLYDVPYPYSFYTEAGQGFTTFDGMQLAPGPGHGVNVQLRSEERKGPEQLTLSASEANHRVVSQLLGEFVQFNDGEARELIDILFARDTGEVAYFVVEMEAQSLFELDRRTIPADIVTIGDDGGISAATGIAGVDEITQQYDESLL